MLKGQQQFCIKPIQRKGQDQRHTVRRSEIDREAALNEEKVLYINVQGKNISEQRKSCKLQRRKISQQR